MFLIAQRVSVSSALPDLGIPSVVAGGSAVTVKAVNPINEPLELSSEKTGGILAENPLTPSRSYRRVCEVTSWLTK
jgi:hypothetical protein